MPHGLYAQIRQSRIRRTIGVETVTTLERIAQSGAPMIKLEMIQAIISLLKNHRTAYGIDMAEWYVGEREISAIICTDTSSQLLTRWLGHFGYNYLTHGESVIEVYFFI